MRLNELPTQIQKILGIFKPLASPYHLGFVLGHVHLSDHQISMLKKVLDSEGDPGIVAEYEKRLAALIGPGFGISFAAGRMAFYSVLKALNIGSGDEVILPGFTCSVMVNAVWRNGSMPVFADIDRDTLGSSAFEIEKKLSPRTKLIVAQHSFGIPCQIDEIVKLAKRRQIFVLEDCAISLDSSINGIPVGNWGDAAIFSTDHSKPLNTVIGGFFYTRDEALYRVLMEMVRGLPDLTSQHQQRLFNQLLFERKNYTPSCYSRTILRSNLERLVRKLKPATVEPTFLEDDYTNPRASYGGSRYPYPAKLPGFSAQLGLFELDRWEKEKRERQALLGGYLKLANNGGQSNYLPKAYRDPDLDIVPLRFVFAHPAAEKWHKKMSSHVDVGSRWFRTPIICCPGGLESFGYLPGMCPTAEAVGRKIVNWPCVVPEGWNARLLRLFQDTLSDLGPA